MCVYTCICIYVYKYTYTYTSICMNIHIFNKNYTYMLHILPSRPVGTYTHLIGEGKVKKGLLPCADRCKGNNEPGQHNGSAKTFLKEQRSNAHRMGLWHGNHPTFGCNTSSLCKKDARTQSTLYLRVECDLRLGVLLRYLSSLCDEICAFCGEDSHKRRK